MGIRYLESFRFRYYMDEMQFCNKTGVDPLPYDLLHKRSLELTKSSFTSEEWFKDHLKNVKNNLDVYQNHPILNRYYADFYIPKLNLVIEIDGSSHKKRKQYDKNRDELFRARGLTVVRIRYLDKKSARKLIHSINLNSPIEKPIEVKHTNWKRPKVVKERIKTVRVKSTGPKFKIRKKELSPWKRPDEFNVTMKF